MQNVTIINQILDHVPEINFGVSFQDKTVSLFETTIRYLGGMLSAYDLLNGPYSELDIDVSAYWLLFEVHYLIDILEIQSKFPPLPVGEPCKQPELCFRDSNGYST